MERVGRGDLELLGELVSTLAGDDAMEKVCDALTKIACGGPRYGDVLAGAAWGALQMIGRHMEANDRIGNGEYGDEVPWSDKSRNVYNAMLLGVE